MVESIEHIISKLSSFSERKIHVACSGGLDSMCLLHILKQSDFDITAIHVNYQLRGKDSELDAQFIQDYCKKNEIPFLSKDYNLSEDLKSGGNLQELARDFRYAWFNRIISDNSSNCIFLAHHRDDQIETFFLNLARKSGVMGLSCMPFKNDEIYRPLLDVDKEWLLDFAKVNGISWREDKSNASNKYRRNLLRNSILPQLLNEIPTLNDSVVLLISKFQNYQLELESKITPLIESIHATSELNINNYQELDDFEKIEFCRQLGQSSHFAEQLSKLSDAMKGKKLDLVASPDVRIQSIYKHGNLFHFTSIKDEEPQYKLIIERVKSIPSRFTKNEIYLDSSKITGELKLREWEIGDRIYPIGVNGSKLVSSIISEAFLSPTKKQQVLVVHDDENIHWVCGYKIGSKAIYDSTTTELIRCSLTALALPK